MQTYKHLYLYNYNPVESDLAKLESKYIFKEEIKNKLLFSDTTIDPSISAYIKKRLDIYSFSDNYSDLIVQIKKRNIQIEGFKIEYIVLNGDTTEYADRLKKLKEIGYSIEGLPDYYNPTITYLLCHYMDIWYFGVSIKNSFAWHKHLQKPCSFSNSISTNIAKALVNIASEANKEKTLLDTCCGVGTIMLEACFAGYKIDGCDINWKACKNARENLSYFNYVANVYKSDIKDIPHHYDAGIIDLPYNLFSHVDENTVLHIIESAAEIATKRLVIVSISDIYDRINNVGWKVSDFCEVKKKGKVKFTRKIWVCEKKVLAKG